MSYTIYTRKTMRNSKGEKEEVYSNPQR